MHPFRLLLVLGAVTIAIGVDVSTTSAQTTAGDCRMGSMAGIGGSATDACQKARDIFAVVVPQVGVALSAGNPILGEGGTTGGWGRRVLTVRLAAAEGYLPRYQVPLSIQPGTHAGDFGAKRTYIPIPSADVAIGLFAGIPAGLTNIGGVDALLGATALPTVSEGSFTIKPAASSFALSYGARLGVLQESSVVPGVSVSYMRRRLPTQNLAYLPGMDTLNVSDVGVTADTWRLVVSKRIAVLGIAAGAGRDRIVGTSTMNAVVNEAGVGGVRSTIELDDVRTEARRSSLFVNASFGIAAARIVGEYGWARAGTIEETVNQFGGRRANDAYRYASLGMTVRF